MEFPKKSCSQPVLNNYGHWAEALTFAAMQGPKKFVIAIGGATAVGKTKLAIAIAKRYGTEIISADSRQFYQEMSIGTAKPSAAELAEVPHHFINTKHVGDLYGAGHFAKDAHACLESLFRNHRVVVVVGGSGLYLNALLEGVDDFVEVPRDVRDRLNQEYREKGLVWLQAALKQADPVYFDSVDQQNPQRLIRALEVCRHSGLPYSHFLQQKRQENHFQTIALFANSPRDHLYARINDRVDGMIRAGLVEEVKALVSFRHVNALKTVGYKEIFAYLDGDCTLAEAVAKIKQHSRNYAKRQITWFKNKTAYKPVDPNNFKDICAYLDKALA